MFQGLGGICFWIIFKLISNFNTIEPFPTYMYAIYYIPEYVSLFLNPTGIFYL